MSKALQPTDPRVIELAKDDGIVRMMLEHHVPLDREGYKEMMFLFGEPPKKWTAELEDEIPELLRDWSKVDRRTA
jgi:hypothetical protein